MHLGNEELLQNADLAPVGAWSLANSDLVQRLKEGAPLNEADPATFFGGGSKGIRIILR
jgi:2,4-dienoyl-CoA reductase-like NADH-dependent reductase (Old Yellow Enzyme family)